MPALVTRRTTAALLTVGGATLIFPGQPARAAAPLVRADLEADFKEAGVVGTFALFDIAADQLTVVNKKRAETQFAPASTFKIPNSLIALETGVIKDENEIVPYGGKPQPIKSWEKDMSIRDAIPISAVPIYQELARRIGLERYRMWLTRLDYGNKETGGNIETFWLDGPLAISAIEEAKFNARLASGKLDATPRAQAIVREIIRLESSGRATLFGKTGWSQKIGWWSGWVEREGKVHAFALNMDMPTVTDAPKRVSVAKSILAKLGVY